MATLLPIDHTIQQQLNQYLTRIEEALQADAIAIIGPIMFGLDNRVKTALELFTNRKDRLAIILDTPGGIAEVVERIVNSIRHRYKEVYFVIPDHAMSAGTIFAMSGDKIFMNYFFCAGTHRPTG